MTEAAADRPIALTGFMGAGKSSVGRLVAEALGRPFHDTDLHVEQATGRSVESFFPDEEPEFRRLEAEAVAELLERGPSVIALGGGALLDERTRALLLERSLLVHLDVPWSELSGDLEALMQTRPLLRGRTLADVHQLFLARQAVYACAHLRVEVGRRGTKAAADEVLRALRLRA